MWSIVRSSLIPALFLSLSCYAWANPTTIPEVRLSSKSTASMLKKPVASQQITQVSRQAIADTPVSNLSEFLRQEQSIIRLTNTSGDPSQTALSMRGFGDNAAANSLILIDGFPLTNPTLQAPRFNMMALSDIERIDVFQGSDGVKWGDQAVGGVINIITRHPKKPYMEDIVSIGSFGKQFYNIFAADTFNHGVFIKLAAFLNKATNYRQHNQQKEYNISPTIGMDYARGSLVLNLQSDINDVNYPGGLSEQQYESNPRQASTFNNHRRLQTQIIRLLNKHELNDQWLLETRLSYDQNNTHGMMTWWFRDRSWTTRFSPRLIGHVDKHQLLLGYDAVLMGYQSTNPKTENKAQALQNNLYAQFTTPLTDTLSLTLGARGAIQENNVKSEKDLAYVHSLNRAFVTEQGLRFHPHPQWSLFLRHSGSMSFPKANEQTWVPANTNALKAQIGDSYETGATFETAKNKSQISIYRLALQNEMVLDHLETPLRPFGSFANIDPTMRYGVTLTEVYQLTEKAKINGQINYVNAYFSSGMYNGNRVPNVPAMNANLGLDYNWTEVWQTKYRALYTSNTYASEDFFNQGKRLPGYWLHDLALQYVKPHYSVNLEGLNIFNQRYTAYASYNLMSKSISYFPAAARSYLLTFKLNLD